MSKYDWVKLEREFVTYAKYAATSLREFAREKGIPYGENFKMRTKGWAEKRVRFQAQKSTKIQHEIQDRQISREVELNERHLRLWGRFLDMIEGSLDNAEAMQLMRGADKIEVAGQNRFVGGDNLHKVVKNLADVMDKAAKGQRLALGLDKDKGAENTEKRLGDMIDTVEEAFKGDEPSGDR